MFLVAPRSRFPCARMCTGCSNIRAQYRVYYDWPRCPVCVNTEQLPASLSLDFLRKQFHMTFIYNQLWIVIGVKMFKHSVNKKEYMLLKYYVRKT